MRRLCLTALLAPHALAEMALLKDDLDFARDDSMSTSGVSFTLKHFQEKLAKSPYEMSKKPGSLQGWLEDVLGAKSPGKGVGMSCPLRSSIHTLTFFSHFSLLHV